MHEEGKHIDKREASLILDTLQMGTTISHTL